MTRHPCRHRAGLRVGEPAGNTIGVRSGWVGQVGQWVGGGGLVGWGGGRVRSRGCWSMPPPRTDADPSGDAEHAQGSGEIVERRTLARGAARYSTAVSCSAMSTWRRHLDTSLSVQQARTRLRRAAATRCDGHSARSTTRTNAHEEDASAEDAHDVPQEERTPRRSRRRKRRSVGTRRVWCESTGAQHVAQNTRRASPGSTSEHTVTLTKKKREVTTTKWGSAEERVTEARRQSIHTPSAYSYRCVRAPVLSR